MSPLPGPASGAVLSRPAAGTEPDRDTGLPAWPVIGLIAGVPLWWLAGLTFVVPGVAAALMLMLLLSVPRVRLWPGTLPLITLSLWCLASTVMIDSALRLVGFGVRWTALAMAALLVLYLTNVDPRRLPDRRLLGCLAVIWLLVIAGGYLGMIAPEVRLTTPMSRVLPGSLLDNPLVRDVVFPPFAEVQRPWGAPEPFNRPSAPFPYTNGWGCALALLTPLMLAWRDRLGTPLARAAVLVGLAASVAPALATRNRGMLLILAVAVTWYVVRQAAAGNWAVAVRVGGAAGAVLTAVVGFGAVQLIAERQLYSDTTTGRAGLYEVTLAEALKSPVLGYGAPRPSQEIGVALGTQGAIWTFLFCYGFVGAAIFVWFLLATIARAAARPASHLAWIEASLVGALAACFFYGFDAIHLMVLACATALLIRSGTGGPADLDATTVSR